MICLLHGDHFYFHPLVGVHVSYMLLLSGGVFLLQCHCCGGICSYDCPIWVLIFLIRPTSGYLFLMMFLSGNVCFLIPPPVPGGIFLMMCCYPGGIVSYPPALWGRMFLCMFFKYPGIIFHPPHLSGTYFYWCLSGKICVVPTRFGEFVLVFFFLWGCFA